MPDATACAPAAFQILDQSEGVVTIGLSGVLDIEACDSLLTGLSSVVAGCSCDTITLDMSSVTRVDDFGVFVVKELKRLARTRQNRLYVTHLSDNVKKSFALFDSFEASLPSMTAVQGQNDPAYLISEVGETALSGIRKLESSLIFIGATLLAAMRAVFSPGTIRFNDTIELIKKAGFDAIPIVGLISFISGLIIAFVASVKLEQYGGHIFIPALITFAMVAEIGPIMTGIVIAGRTGSAYAAEIGTMKISEEIDALTSMGFDPVLFLVIPRLSALLLALPILTVLSVIFAVTGGLVVSVALLNLLPGPYIQGAIDALFIKDIIWGLAKSAVFAILIAMIGCLRGFQVRGGAASVGSAATSAVVGGIFLIIFFDSIAAVIRIYWG